jgi:hypothetical protein
VFTHRHAPTSNIRYNIIMLIRQRPSGKIRRTRVDNIKMDLSEIGWGGMDWIHLAQQRDQWRALVNTAMNLRLP